MDVLRPYLHFTPQVAPSAYVDSSAQVIGNVVIGERSFVGPLVTIRGDVNAIRIGDDTVIEDNCVLHCEPVLFPLVIGNRVIIDHRATVHGCVIEDDCVVGLSAVILNGANIGSGSLIDIGAVVIEGAKIPPASFVSGIPGRVIRQVSAEELARNAERRSRIAKSYQS